MSTNGLGLRERRRRQTLLEIHAVALRLARERGFDKLSVEMISAEAGISPRTFFNYFPSKEAAILLRPPTPTPEALARFVAAGRASRHEVVADLIQMLLEEMSQGAPDPREMRAVLEVAAASPAVLAVLLAGFDAMERSVAAAVAQRLDPGGDDEFPDLVAAVVIGALRSALRRWAEAVPADTDDSPLPRVERALTTLQSLLSL